MMVYSNELINYEDGVIFICFKYKYYEKFIKIK